ncbi:MAG: peptidylprolyl isomerase [Dysgonamonadaceae bacterium]|jgi:peptidyl-prolyl cis-trans isomerase SurA|nr:peptidylprolyl isomerase [Dysgonamonadaceae bacterium]
MRNKYLFWTLSMTLLWFFSPLHAQKNVIDEVIWVIGDEAILRSDVESVRMEMQMMGQRFNGDPYCFIPEQIAIQKLFLHQAALDSLTVNESQVMQYVEMRINDAINQVGSKEKLEEYISKTIPEYREELRENVRNNQLVQEVRRNLIGTIKVTPSDIRKYYSRIPQDSLPYMQTTVEVQIITMQPTISLAEIDEVKGRLREFTDQVNKGEREFSTLARMYSEDTESAKRGGELGFLGKGTFLPEFAAVAFDLNDPKRISRIVETEYGFHIIQLIEKRGDRINVRHILLKPKVSESELAEASARLDTVRANILEKKYTFEEAALYLSFDKDTRYNKGLMVNQPREDMVSERSGTSHFQMEELPAEISKVVDKMEIGDISEPFKMINKNQKEVIAIVKLKSRIPGHKANIADDYQALKMLVEQQKSEEILNKWIAQKQKETYIRINDNWKNCDFERDGWIKE